MREPLVHFLFLGLLIFAVDQAVRSDAKDPRVIVVDDAVREELIGLFEEAQGRAPTDAQLETLIDQWLYNEIMYREALALGLDKGDEMFRSRLELKLRMMLINNTVLDPPTEDDLRQWFEEHRERYTAPRRFDFVQFQIDGEGTAAERAAAETAAGMVDGAIPEPYDARARFYRNRSRENIAAVFGEGFADGLLDGERNGWRAVRSQQGWHVARVQRDTPPIAPDFEALKPQIETEWEKFHQKRLAQEAFRDIRDSYEIRREDTSRKDPPRREDAQ